MCHQSVQISRLNEIVVGMLVLVSTDNSGCVEWRKSSFRFEGECRSGGVGEVVGGGTTVTINCHWAVALAVGNAAAGCVGTVDRDLLVVDSETVTMGVRVTEQTTYKN